jgi:hypothetical protein
MKQRVFLTIGGLFVLSLLVCLQAFADDTIQSSFSLCVNDDSGTEASTHPAGGVTTVTLKMRNDTAHRFTDVTWSWFNDPPNPPTVAFSGWVPKRADANHPGIRTTKFQWVGPVRQNGGTITFRRPDPPSAECGGTFVANLFRDMSNPPIGRPRKGLELNAELWDGDSDDEEAELLVRCTSRIIQNDDTTWSAIREVTNFTESELSFDWFGFKRTVKPGETARDDGGGAPGYPDDERSRVLQDYYPANLSFDDEDLGQFRIVANLLSIAFAGP